LACLQISLVSSSTFLPGLRYLVTVFFNLKSHNALRNLVHNEANLKDHPVTI
jgi:hypothetical protein